MEDPCINVYKPSEDTYLTIRALDILLGTRFLKARGDLIRIVEVGSGTGIVTISFLKKLRNAHVHAVLTDIKYDAARCTYKNIKEQGLDALCDVVQTDVMSALRYDLNIDILISNPPYLPVSEDELCEPEYCGGPTGREVIDRIVHEFCSRKIRILVLTQSSLSNPGLTIRQLRKKGDVVLAGRVHILFEDIVTIICMRD